MCSVAFADSKDGERFKPVIDQALNEQKIGNHKTAIKLFKKVYSKSEDFKRDALLGLISSLKDSKKWDDAIEILKLETKRSPFIGEYRIWLAEFYLNAEKFTEALSEIDSAEKILGQENSVLRLKAAAQKKLKKYKDATETLTIFLNQNPKDHTALIDRADCYFQQKLFTESYKDLQKAYEIRPFEEDVLAPYTKSAYFSHNYREARRVGRECTRLFPKNASCFEYLGKSAVHKKDYAKASTFFESTVFLDPTRVDVRQLMAESLALSGRTAESDAQFETILKQRPEYESAMRSWSIFLGQRKKIEVLGEKLKTFYKKNPDNLWCAVELSKLLFFVGDQDSALEQMELTSKENKSANAKFYYAHFLDLSGKYEKTRTLLAEVKEPSLNVDFHMALSLLKENKISEAIQYWLKVPSESPLYFKAQVNAALAYEQQSNIDKAKEILKALVPPADYRKSLEKKLNFLDADEERKPASQPSSELTYFTDWDMPEL